MRNKIFIISMLLVITILPLIIIVRTPKKFSNLENRSLLTINSLKGNNILNNEFQDNLEQFLNDQMLLGQKFKEYYNFFKNVTGIFLLDYFYKDKKENELVPLGISEDVVLYKLNKSDYVVYKPYDFKEGENALLKHIANINDIKNKLDTEIYVFYVNKDVDYNNYNLVNEYMKNNLNKNIKYSDLNVLYKDGDYYNNYKKYYYKTDHHWNYKGSYEGYKLIASMMNDKIINFDEEVCFDDIKFVGSKGKKTGDFLNYDNFCTYKFSLKEHDVYINGELKNYGNKEQYYNLKYPKSTGVNYYASFYGSDYGEVVFDYKNSKKDNLLIFSNSFSNAINDLIASSYNKTHVIDLRAYKMDLGKDFDIKDYVKENKIDKILFLGDKNFFSLDTFLIN